jgi:hypothetical protein
LYNLVSWIVYLMRRIEDLSAYLRPVLNFLLAFVIIQKDFFSLAKRD